jgi:hypothetical protein
MWKELAERIFARQREKFFLETTPLSPVRVFGRLRASSSVLEIVLERSTIRLSLTVLEKGLGRLRRAICW